VRERPHGHTGGVDLDNDDRSGVVAVLGQADRDGQERAGVEVGRPARHRYPRRRPSPTVRAARRRRGSSRAVEQGEHEEVDDEPGPAAELADERADAETTPQPSLLGTDLGVGLLGRSCGHPARYPLAADTTSR
jgi:hypothetical protein